MLVTRDQLKSYTIPSDEFFSRRTGSGTPISRDQFYINNPDKLIEGTHCAIGSDEKGWELEQFNGINWMIVIPDPSYNLTITTKGLAALTDILHGGIRLNFSGLKIIDNVVNDPAISLEKWTNDEFEKHGKLKLSIGTTDAYYKDDADGNSYLNRVLSWRYNSSSGGLQYILTLPEEGIGALSNESEEKWDIGTIGLYIKDPLDGNTDVLFAIGCLPSKVTKYSNTEDSVGNKLKFYFNTILTNIGYVANVEVLESGDQNIPEVPTETLLEYPANIEKRAYNCYFVRNLYGTNVPALAVPRYVYNGTTEAIDDWTFFRPSDNVLHINDTALFDSTVANFMAVYWNGTKYYPAEGRIPSNSRATNNKMPIGIRVNNNIIYNGEITNNVKAYEYILQTSSIGANYAVNDELLILANDNLTFKVIVKAVNGAGGITNFTLEGPKVGNIKLISDTTFQPAIYSPTSPLPRQGTGARFGITSTEITKYTWNFTEGQLNKPVYCGNGSDAGKPVFYTTDCFLGWVTGTNSIKLGLDLRNEASETNYGTTRYATNTEVKEVESNPNGSNQTAVTPRVLKDNYLQITMPSNANQKGYSQSNPINVETYVRFDKMILGKGTRSPYTDETLNPNVNDANISFYGLSYRSEWGDLAEFYESDVIYEPGTLITIGKGDKEISIATEECNGIISSKPGYQLGNKESDNYLPVALVGRVPVLMDGLCMPRFGQKIYLSKVKPGYASTIENGKCLGKIITKNPGTNRILECSVRIDF